MFLNCDGAGFKPAPTALIPLCPSDISPVNGGNLPPVLPGHTPLASLRSLAPLSQSERGGGFRSPMRSGSLGRRLWRCRLVGLGGFW